jgi:hypothetical protein
MVAGSSDMAVNLARLRNDLLLRKFWHSIV